MTPQHQWVRHTVKPVDVVVNPLTDEPEVVERSEADIEELLGCRHCSIPMDKHSVRTNCIASPQ